MRRTPNTPFTLVAMLVLMPMLGGARGCEDDVDVGGDEDGGVTLDGGGAYDPCAGSSCGDSCSLCDPADSECVETSVEKMCQPDGTCSATVAECSAPYDPCAGLSCGSDCSTCDPSDPTCVEPSAPTFCQFSGACSSTSPECIPPYVPCAGLSCGETCTVCDPTDTDCEETAVVKMCQPDGGCSATTPECVYDPCGGVRSCGDSCTLCDPADSECVETAVEKMCQPDGGCSATVADCRGACGATARQLVGDTEVDLEEGVLCDDLYLCLDSGRDGSPVEAASSAFDCTTPSSPDLCPSGTTSCQFIGGPSTLDASELREICAAQAASRETDTFLCAVYL